MTLWGPAPQAVLVLRQNSPKLCTSAYKSEIINLHTFMLTQYDFCLSKEFVYPGYYFLMEPIKLHKFA